MCVCIAPCALDDDIKYKWIDVYIHIIISFEVYMVINFIV